MDLAVLVDFAGALTCAYAVRPSSRLKARLLSYTLGVARGAGSFEPGWPEGIVEE